MRQVRGFIGLATYYKKFIQGFGEIARPLHLVKEVKGRLEWNNECQQAYERLREALLSDNVLTLPDFELPFILETDASNYGVGAVLIQKQENKGRPIAYFSKGLNKTEQNYSTSEKELYAIVLAVEHFKHYLFAKKFTVVTDHKPLRWLYKCKKLSNRLSKYLIRLEPFDFEIIYRGGALNGGADGLSRLTDESLEEHDDVEEFLVCLIEIQSENHNEALRIYDNKLREAQTLDNDIIWIKQLILDHGNSKPCIEENLNDVRKDLLSEYNNLIIVDNTLWRKKTDSQGRTIEQFVVPTNSIQEVLKRTHSSIFCGHLGIERTTVRVNERFYWPASNKIIKEYVQQCESCQKIKITKGPLAPMKPLKPTRPRELVTADVTGPLPVSSKQNQYILVVCDHFTKLVKYYAMKSQKADVVAKNLINYFMTYGIPDSILSDQGTNFMSNVLDEIYELLDVKRIRTSPFHPQTDGITERHNRTLKEMISAFISSDQRNWDENLDCLAFA